MSGISRPTIVALSSGAVPSGVAVYRISGPAARDVASSVAGPMSGARRASLRWFRHPGTGERLDRGLLLWLPAPGSFTGEDSVELQGHGGPAVVSAVLDAILSIAGTRLAEPGEFARRAFENGRLDLTAVEGLADLVAAETEAQRRQALRQMDGALERLYGGWGDELVRALAHWEAYLDFPDETMPLAEARSIATTVDRIRGEMERHLADDRRGERIRGGIRVVIVGAPNVGKSSLLNRLIGWEAAITSPSPGTTRDPVEARLDLGGYVVSIVDTAGLRAVADPVEAEGVRRAEATAREADYRLVVVTPGTAAIGSDPTDPDAIRVVNKVDLLGRWKSYDGALPVSALTGEGIDRLLDTIRKAVEARIGCNEAPVLSRRRHRDSLADAIAALHRFGLAREGELAAEDLRLAVRALGRITGVVDVEDLLDIIFRDFCIGK